MAALILSILYFKRQLAKDGWNSKIKTHLDITAISGTPPLIWDRRRVAGGTHLHNNARCSSPLFNEIAVLASTYRSLTISHCITLQFLVLYNRGLSAFLQSDLHWEYYWVQSRSKSMLPQCSHRAWVDFNTSESISHAFMPVKQRKTFLLF